MKRNLVLLIVALAAAGLLLAGCGPETQPPTTPCPTAAACPACPDCPTCPECPVPVVEQVPFADQWLGSGHADALAEAFVHWDAEDPPEIPVTCARCHSTPGYLDYLGADGSAAGVVDMAAPIGTVVTCEACHNAVTAELARVVFPSGGEVIGLGAESRCMVCHQGNASGPAVDKAIADAGASDEDTVADGLGFINIHYYAAAATVYGKFAQGGYQYADKMYDGRLDHVTGYDTCIGCHNSHTLEVKVAECATCHAGVTASTLASIRMPGSAVDYDGDGDIAEGIAAEMDGLREKLYLAMRAYSKEVAGASIAYSAAAYPYFFIDTNDDGQAGADEAVYPNRYVTWTPRLVKAAYNYQVSLKDPGAYAHGGKYIIQLLFDSTESLNERVSQPVDMSAARREDAGHFAGSTEAFRHWDAEGEVATACVKCHTGEGLPMFLKNGATIATAPSNGLLCTTCHSDLLTYARYEVGAVRFPSGTSVDTGSPDSNLCLNCHQGRDSGVSVAGALTGLEEDTVSDRIRFRNIHYFAAGATLFGGDVQGIFQYPGQEYVGRNAHVPGFDNCTSCHDSHGLTVNVTLCGTCHPVVKTAADLEKIRLSTIDYDGDGDTTEGILGELATYQERLLAAIQDYAESVAGAPIAYDAYAHPYFSGANGQAYTAWTPRLLKAAYNYQYAQKDPGAFAHNPKYVIQALYDSLTDLGARVTVDMTGMVRP